MVRKSPTMWGPMKTKLTSLTSSNCWSHVEQLCYIGAQHCIPGLSMRPALRFLFEVVANREGIYFGWVMVFVNISV